MTMTKQADGTLDTIRRLVNNRRYLWIDEDISDESGLAVFDTRDGGNTGTFIRSIESLKFLVDEGAEEWLASVHNNVKQSANRLLNAALGILALIEEHGIGDNDYQSEPAVAEFRAAIRAQSRR